ncbi:hypothetical protein DBO85_03575 [Pseudomonas mangrovi]|uniref:Uncharacterized protein n=1 Tax=Pseudomonas mangrovi TaxID=2161748 RepID=A0A2T5PDG0_9PSED|nr:hypothetical protein DBO85_03575 [Pseudomonas mangrovi]
MKPSWGRTICLDGADRPVTGINDQHLCLSYMAFAQIAQIADQDDLVPDSCGAVEIRWGKCSCRVDEHLSLTGRFHDDDIVVDVEVRVVEVFMFPCDPHRATIR